MKLRDYVLQSVFEYPRLYITNTYEESRLKVLHHCFLVLGNGLGWAYTKNPAKGGYLVDPKYRKIHGDWIRNYDSPYGKEKFDMDWEDLMGYAISESLFDKYGIREEARKWREELGISHKNNERKIYNTNIFREGLSHPYPFSKQYWPFAEINPVLIQADWREGMIDIKKWALSFFEDVERYRADTYFNCTGSSLEKHIKNPVNKAKYNNWSQTLKAYGLPNENIKENDFESMAFIRNEKKRQEYIEDLKYAISVLENL